MAHIFTVIESEIMTKCPSTCTADYWYLTNALLTKPNYMNHLNKLQLYISQV